MLIELIFEKLIYLLVPMWKLTLVYSTTMTFSFCNVSSKLKGGLGIIGSFSVLVR
jgi:hypothetical protein